MFLSCGIYILSTELLQIMYQMGPGITLLHRVSEFYIQYVARAVLIKSNTSKTIKAIYNLAWEKGNTPILTTRENPEIYLMMSTNFFIKLE